MAERRAPETAVEILEESIYISPQTLKRPPPEKADARSVAFCSFFTGNLVTGSVMFNSSSQV
jgi:hypothetical protein